MLIFFMFFPYVNTVGNIGDLDEGMKKAMIAVMAVGNRIMTSASGSDGIKNMEEIRNE